MIRFECDYAEGAHEKVLQHLVATNGEQAPGYGEDDHCENARRLIRELCGSEDLAVHFLVGGTQANTTVIAAVLRPHQGVLSAQTGHINTHESGAIEATGHRILAINSKDGKLTGEQIHKYCTAHRNDPTRVHTVQPGMVYISNPTENGTTYTKAELEALSAACREWELPLFLDGARLGYGLVAEGNDLTLPDLARLCDAFSIGGTKVGALFGEAVVIPNTCIAKDFRYHIKQRGGMLAKGRLLGVQFEALFQDGLYFEISRHAVEMGLRLKEAFAAKGYAFLYDSATNQQFPILLDDDLDKLLGKYSFSIWEKVHGHYTAVRFCTSWATREEHVEQLVKDIRSL